MKQTLHVTEKPEWITYEDIYRLVYRAHEENRKNGIYANEQITSGADLLRELEEIGAETVTFVAMDRETPVGTVTVCLQQGQGAYTKGKNIACLRYVGVLPEHAGKGAGGKLLTAAEDYARGKGAVSMEAVVLEANPAYAYYRKRGYLPVKYTANKRKQTYSVHILKWLAKKSRPDWYILLKFRKHRAQKRKRFGFQDGAAS